MYFIKFISAIIWRKEIGRIRDRKMSSKIDIQTRDVRGLTVLTKEKKG